MTGPRRSTRSVRFRVTAVATLAVLLVLVAAGVALVVSQERLLTSDLDRSLGQRAAEIAARVTAGDRLALSGDGDDAMAQVVGADGEVIAASPNIAGQPPLGARPAPDRDEIIRTARDLPVDDDAFRLLTRVVDAPRGTVVVHVAASLEDVEESTAAIATSLFVAVPSVAALLAAVSWWLLGRALAPVEAIRAEVAEISGGDLTRRVPEPAGDDEIARLARTMNAMLGRLEEASARQQQFVADASHELRSPLARIRSEVEVDLAHPGGADLRATHRSVLEEAVGLQRLVDDLLHLARSDAGAVATGRDPVDLSEIVTAEAERLRAEGRLVVNTDAVDTARVRGDAGQLARAVGNLADNAARYATTTVTLASAEHDGHVTVTVADDGPGVAADDRERIFERFTRLDDSRTAGTGRSGLGLAIARDAVRRHGGSLTVDPDHAPGARFVIALPVS